MKRVKLVPICAAMMIAASCGFVACSSSDSPSNPGPKEDSGAGDASNDRGATDGSRDATPSNDATNDSDNDNDGVTTDPTYTVTAGGCFNFDTLSEVPDCSSGELRTMTGGNVDLASTDGSFGLLCELPGTYTQLADVPSSYDDCTWGMYVEGMGGLANHGLIIRDPPENPDAHHFRVRVVSNTLPTLVFSVAQID